MNEILKTVLWNEILKTVYELNNEIQEKFSEEFLLEFQSNGYCSIIKFSGYVIWSSEDDERKFFEDKNEYEPLGNFLRKECNRIIDILQKQKFIIE